jgi:hypothetical protein
VHLKTCIFFIVSLQINFDMLSWDAKSMIPILVFIDREPVSGQIFSEKRSKLLKIAAKTASMGSAELFQRRL